MNNAILILGMLFIIMALATGAVMIDFSTCITVHGIDHNSSNDPFTVFLGDCY